MAQQTPVTASINPSDQVASVLVDQKVEAPVQESIPMAAPEQTNVVEHGSALDRLPASEPDVGGDVPAVDQPEREAEEKIRATRSFTEVLDRKEEFIRYQLSLLEEQRKALGEVIDEELEDQYRESVRALTSLLKDEKKAEQYMLSSLQELWQAQGRTGEGTIVGASAPFRGFALYPVNPDGGITAGFHDTDYRKIFPFDHNGVDFRAPQGTTVRAPADGTVIEVKDENGLGFNFLRIQHADGVVTLYRHITESLVKEGQVVSAGDPIAKSGGMPGTNGAGAFTTGPHLHFQLNIDGVAVDPTGYLPAE